MARICHHGPPQRRLQDAPIRMPEHPNSMLQVRTAGQSPVHVVPDY